LQKENYPPPARRMGARQEVRGWWKGVVRIAWCWCVAYSRSDYDDLGLLGFWNYLLPFANQFHQSVMLEQFQICDYIWSFSIHNLGKLSF